MSLLLNALKKAESLQLNQGSLLAQDMPDRQEKKAGDVVPAQADTLPDLVYPSLTEDATDEHEELMPVELSLDDRVNEHVLPSSVLHQPSFASDDHDGLDLDQRLARVLALESERLTPDVARESAPVAKRVAVEKFAGEPFNPLAGTQFNHPLDAPMVTASAVEPSAVGSTKIDSLTSNVNQSNEHSVASREAALFIDSQKQFRKKTIWQRYRRSLVLGGITVIGMVGIAAGFLDETWFGLVPKALNPLVGDLIGKKTQIDYNSGIEQPRGGEKQIMSSVTNSTPSPNTGSVLNVDITSKNTVDALPATSTPALSVLDKSTLPSTIQPQPPTKNTPLINSATLSATPSGVSSTALAVTPSSSVVSENHPLNSVELQTKKISVDVSPRERNQIDRWLSDAWDAYQKGDYTTAKTLYERARKLDYQQPDVLMGLAAVAIQSNDKALAARYYREILQSDPNDQAAKIALLNLNVREASSANQNAAMINSDSQAQTNASLDRLQQQVNQQPSAEGFFALGNALAQKNRWYDAQMAYFKAVELAPNQPLYVYNLAVSLDHLSQFKLALNYYQQTLMLNERYASSMVSVSAINKRIEQLSQQFKTVDQSRDALSEKIESIASTEKSSPIMPSKSPDEVLP